MATISTTLLFLGTIVPPSLALDIVPPPNVIQWDHGSYRKKRLPLNPNQRSIGEHLESWLGASVIDMKEEKGAKTSGESDTTSSQPTAEALVMFGSESRWNRGRKKKRPKRPPPRKFGPKRNKKVYFDPKHSLRPRMPPKPKMAAR